MESTIKAISWAVAMGVGIEGIHMACFHTAGSGQPLPIHIRNAGFSENEIGLDDVRITKPIRGF